MMFSSHSSNARPRHGCAAGWLLTSTSSSARPRRSDRELYLLNHRRRPREFDLSRSGRTGIEPGRLQHRLALGVVIVNSSPGDRAAEARERTRQLPAAAFAREIHRTVVAHRHAFSLRLAYRPEIDPSGL